MNKYVIIQNGDIQTAIFLCQHVLHKTVTSLSPDPKSMAGTLVSAGFWSFGENCRIKVSGESTSLELKSRIEDAGIIEDTLLIMGLHPHFNLKARTAQLARAACKLSPVDADNSIGMSTLTHKRKEHPMVPVLSDKNPSDQTTEREIPAEVLA